MKLCAFIRMDAVKFVQGSCKTMCPADEYDMYQVDPIMIFLI
jgi:hypothetical protein